jgi:hypothetical protein
MSVPVFVSLSDSVALLPKIISYIYMKYNKN